MSGAVTEKREPAVSLNKNTQHINMIFWFLRYSIKKMLKHNYIVFSKCSSFIGLTWTRILAVPNNNIRAACSWVYPTYYRIY